MTVQVSPDTGPGGAVSATRVRSADRIARTTVDREGER